ncbi:MAG: SDR family oxidoreductase [Alphaproteobacteria bacterium]|nr:SDR family oxidoreductase [Alphaproteobacteria bacterium]MCB9692345.1 SDR family oxidoreductase [Alphaproteobacteria bacterium]
MAKLSGKTVLVTGGSRGLGRAMVERLARDGATVVLTYRSDADAAASVVAAVEAAGGRAHAIQADQGTLADVEALFAKVDATLGGGACLDGLIANAGIMQHATIEEVDEAAWDRMFDVNVKGVFFTVQAALPRLRDGGRVILLGTGLTRFFMPQYVAYTAAKGALVSLTGVLAKQLGARGITVNMLAPGAIDTDMNPWLKTPEGIAAMRGMTALDRVGHAEDIADVAAFLASDDSRWVTGQRIEASGGQHL